MNTTLKFCDELKLHAQRINNNEWACLVDLRQWKPPTVDIWAPVDALNFWSNTHNQKYEAIIYSTSMQKDIMIQSHEVFTNLITGYFDDPVNAYQWLEDFDLLDNPRSGNPSLKITSSPKQSYIP